MPRESQNVYEYTNKGKFVRRYNSISEFSECNNLEKNIHKRYTRIFNDVFYVFEDGGVVAFSKIGRVKVLEFNRWNNSPINKEKNRAKNIYRYELYDMSGDLIATFKNAFVLNHLLKINIESKFIYSKRNENLVKMSNGIDVKRVKN